MIEFFMSRHQADRYKAEHGGEVYHHSSRKYWLIADRTAHGESFYAAHPYVVTDALILGRVSVHKRYTVFGLSDNGEWNRITGTYKSPEKAEEQIELYKMLMKVPGWTAYKDFKIMERATTLRSFDVVRQVR